VWVTFERTGDRQQDFDLLAAVHETLVSYHGQDRFNFVLRYGPEGDQMLEFPNDTTRYCRDLGIKLADMVGPNAVRVEDGGAGSGG
jgi:hypothetical protein